MHVADVDEVLAGDQRAAFQPGHVEQVADVPVQPLGLLADALQQVAPGRIVERLAEVEQGRARAEHGRQRRAQVVAGSRAGPVLRWLPRPGPGVTNPTAAPRQ
jgi:hypothetical protein